MTDPMVIAVAAGSVIAALTTAAVTVIAAVASAKRSLLENAETTARASALGRQTIVTKLDEGNKQGEEIHKLVNSSATMSANKISALETQVTALLAQVKQLQEQRVVDAQAGHR